MSEYEVDADGWGEDYNQEEDNEKVEIENFYYEGESIMRD
jgi:hypothetical protein